MLRICILRTNGRWCEKSGVTHRLLGVSAANLFRPARLVRAVGKNAASGAATGPQPHGSGCVRAHPALSVLYCGGAPKQFK